MRIPIGGRVTEILIGLFAITCWGYLTYYLLTVEKPEATPMQEPVMMWITKDEDDVTLWLKKPEFCLPWGWVHNAENGNLPFMCLSDDHPLAQDLEPGPEGIKEVHLTEVQ